VATRSCRTPGRPAHAGGGDHPGLGGVASACIAELGDQGYRADRGLRVTEQRPKDLRVGVGGKSLPDLGGELCDLLTISQKNKGEVLL
jgi:hypothetical protein